MYKIILLPIFGMLVVSSCSLLKKATTNPASNNEPKKLTYLKNGSLYETEIEKDATPPVEYQAFNTPTLQYEFKEKEPGWQLQSLNGVLNSNNASIDYALLSRGQNAYYPKIDKKNILEIRIYKDSTKSCKVVNYKFSRQNREDRPAHAIAFVMDHSGSMGSNRAHLLQQGLDSAINFKNLNDEVTIIKFDNNIAKIITSADKAQLQSKLRPSNGLDGFGSATALQDAISIAISNLIQSKNTDKQIFLITDGQENSSTMASNLDSLIDYANKHEIIINTIGFGDNVNENYLQHISDKTGGYFEHIYSTDELKHVFAHSYQRVNNNFKLKFRPCMFSDTLYVETTIGVGNDKFKSKKIFTYKLNLGSIIDFQVLFEKDKANIDEIYLPQINEMIDFLKVHPTIELELRGHTDSDGDNAYNLKLSQKRADAIKNYMVKKGISANRLTAVGYGETEPIYNDDSEESMFLNRRTEAKITKF